jgi:hypothetical protein
MRAVAMPLVAALGDNLSVPEGNVIPFPASARRYGSARLANAGGGRGAGPGDRGRRRIPRRGARVILWPHAYRPRRLEDHRSAVVFTWRQLSAGVIDDVETHCRLEELAAMRGWIA